MNDLQRIESYGIIPVIKLENEKDTLPVLNALSKGGLPVAEITFRTEAAEEAIRIGCANMPDMLIGAGTVLSIEQAQKARAAGARFVVTPGYNDEVVRWCVEQNILVIPGCPTTSDIESARRHGLDVLKFFPAETMGGLPAIKAVSAPYGNVRFIPTGGIGESNMVSYLKSPSVVAVGGSWMVKEDLIAAGQFDEITRLTQKAVSTMLGFSLGHVGIKARDADDASQIAHAFSSMFSWPADERSSAWFAGSGIEAVKNGGRGQNGHIAIQTHSVLRAMAYLKRQGVRFIEESISMKNGKPVLAYLEQEVGGFALHLIQN